MAGQEAESARDASDQAVTSAELEAGNEEDFLPLDEEPPPPPASRHGRMKEHLVLLDQELARFVEEVRWGPSAAAGSVALLATPALPLLAANTRKSTHPCALPAPAAPGLTQRGRAGEAAEGAGARTPRVHRG